MGLLPAFTKTNQVRACRIASVLLLAMLPELQAETFKAALVARTNISLGSSILVDSFDSSNPNYSIRGQYDPSIRRDGGNLVLTENQTNGQIGASSGLGGWCEIYGRAYIGEQVPEVYLGTNGTLGSTTWNYGNNPGIEDGWIVEHPGGYLPGVPVPPIGGLVFPAKGVVVFQGIPQLNSHLLTSGNYQASSIQLSSSEKILVQGHVKLYVPTDFKMSGQSQVIIGTNSSLTLYVGRLAQFLGGGVINRTGVATNLTVYGLKTCTNILYAGGSDFIGTIYAPDSTFGMGPTGSSIYHLVGSVVASGITINGKYQIHYDEGLPPLTLYPSAAATLGLPLIGSGGLLQFEVSGVPRVEYVVESSTNLIDWSSEYTNSSPFTFTNNETGSEQRFFRAVYQP